MASKVGNFLPRWMAVDFSLVHFVHDNGNLKSIFFISFTHTKEVYEATAKVWFASQTNLHYSKSSKELCTGYKLNESIFLAKWYLIFRYMFKIPSTTKFSAYPTILTPILLAVKSRIILLYIILIYYFTIYAINNQRNKHFFFSCFLFVPRSSIG